MRTNVVIHLAFYCHDTIRFNEVCRLNRLVYMASRLGIHTRSSRRYRSGDFFAERHGGYDQALRTKEGE